MPVLWLMYVMKDGRQREKDHITGINFYLNFEWIIQIFLLNLTEIYYISFIQRQTFYFWFFFVFPPQNIDI